MKSFLYFLFLFSTAFAQAQRTVDVDKNDVDPTRGFFYSVQGEPFSIAKYIRVVDGSPYFNDTWMLGSVMMSNGHRYDSLHFKLDLLANELHFLDLQGRELVAAGKLSELWLTDSVSGAQSHFVYSSAIVASSPPENGWYQLLAIGNADLFVRLHKDITEFTPYNSATTEQSIKTTAWYFVVVNKVFSRIKKFSELSDLLSNKSAEIKSFINTNHLSGRSANDYTRVVTYYNSLSPQ